MRYCNLLPFCVSHHANRCQTLSKKGECDLRCSLRSEEHVAALCVERTLDGRAQSAGWQDLDVRVYSGLPGCRNTVPASCLLLAST
jgi:hypothetical protein